jgi:hypothetical protein
LRKVENLYNDLRVEHATTKESSKTNHWIEILSFTSSAIGAAGIGAAPSYMAAPDLSGVGWIIAIGSAILVLVGIAARLSK